MKIRLNVDSLTVESFKTGREVLALRGTVDAHQMTRACNTRSPFCQLPSINIPCITDEVECGA
ncbi:MAG TPA: hypothetical protein VGX50_00195 [Longimicrobium sp.]|nr:hypothetical protein [Longimicrobium sp.]